MEKHHWFLLLFVLGVGYFLGIYFPSYGTQAVARAQAIV